jgi:hypothetical protein
MSDLALIEGQAHGILVWQLISAVKRNQTKQGKWTRNIVLL